MAGRLDGIPSGRSGSAPKNGPNTFREISYREANGVGWLSFEFLNGAMSVDQCRRLLDAFRHAAAGSASKVIVLAGGREFWSNGMHLGVIEAAASPADASWANINAIDDVARAVLLTTDKLVIAALEGNAGAGGVFLALAADQVLMRDGIVLNPHYKNMGNLFGSEYWTYVLPRRVGPDRVGAVIGSRLPMGAARRSASVLPMPCCPMRDPHSARPCAIALNGSPPIRHSTACLPRSERGACATKLSDRSMSIGSMNSNACGSPSTASIRAITWRDGASSPASRSRARHYIWRVIDRRAEQDLNAKAKMARPKRFELLTPRSRGLWPIIDIARYFCKLKSI